tara:strand:- start:872 stop:1150 length:279 start_codon:yes stop_codon:yes gene_type:complete
MSIVFKPKIPKDFSYLAPVPVIKEVERKYKRRFWSAEEKDQLVALRAMGVSLHDCAATLRRGQGSIAAILNAYELHGAIWNLRQTNIDRIMK